MELQRPPNSTRTRPIYDIKYNQALGWIRKPKEELFSFKRNEVIQRKWEIWGEGKNKKITPPLPPIKYAMVAENVASSLTVSPWKVEAIAAGIDVEKRDSDEFR